MCYNEVPVYYQNCLLLIPRVSSFLQHHMLGPWNKIFFWGSLLRVNFEQSSSNLKVASVRNLMVKPKRELTWPRGQGLRLEDSSQKFCKNSNLKQSNPVYCWSKNLLFSIPIFLSLFFSPLTQFHPFPYSRGQASLALLQTFHWDRHSIHSPDWSIVVIGCEYWII